MRPQQPAKPQPGAVIRVIEYNGPESGKKGLVKPPSRRPPRFMRIANRRGATAIGGQEWGMNLREEARRRKHWRVFYATPNSHAWGNIQACGVLVNKRQARVIDADQFITNGLHGPAALVEHKRTGFRWVQIAAHVPTTHSGPNAAAMRLAYNQTLHAYLEKLRGAPFIVCADSNSGVDWADRFADVGAHVVRRDGVCVILASRHFKTRRTYTIKRPNLSDHNIVGATVKATRVGEQLTALPKG